MVHKKIQKNVASETMDLKGRVFLMIFYFFLSLFILIFATVVNFPCSNCNVNSGYIFFDIIFMIAFSGMLSWRLPRSKLDIWLITVLIISPIILVYMAIR